MNKTKGIYGDIKACAIIPNTDRKSEETFVEDMKWQISDAYLHIAQ